MDTLAIATRVLMDALEESGGNLLKISGFNDDGRPCFAVIAVKGDPETGEILNAINSIEEEWERERVDDA